MNRMRSSGRIGGALAVAGLVLVLGGPVAAQTTTTDGRSTTTTAPGTSTTTSSSATSSTTTTAPPTTTTTTPPALSAVVEKTNDADGDGTFHQAETLVVDPEVSGLRGEVSFRAVIGNQSQVSLRVETVTDRYGETSSEVCGELLGAAIPPGGSATCEFTLADYGPPTGAFLENTLVVQISQAGDPANTATVSGSSRVDFVVIGDPRRLGLSVDKTNDADRDGAFSHRETLVVDPSIPGLRGSVPFQVAVGNQGTQPLVIERLIDSFGMTEREVCPSLVGGTLQPEQTAVCTFTVEDYAPDEGGAEQTNTVRVEATPIGSEGSVAGEDSSVVDFVKILPETTTTVGSGSGSPSATGAEVSVTLPHTGSTGRRLGAAAAALLAGGAVLTLTFRERLLHLRGTDWLAERE